MQALWMLVASLMFALMGAGVKFASDQGTALGLIVLARGLPSVVLILVWALLTHHSLKPTSVRLHIQRNIFGSTALWLVFFSYGFLPLASATSLNYTSSLFIGAWVIYQAGRGQRDMWRLLAVLLGFLGVLLILRPSITEEQWIGALAGLGSGFFASIAMFQIKSLGQVGEPVWRTVFYFSIVICLTGLIAVQKQDVLALGLSSTITLLGVGVFGMLGQLCMTQAYGAGSPMLAAVLQYSTIIFAALIGIVIWDTIPDIWAWLGMGLIIFAGVFSAWRTMQQNRLSKPVDHSPSRETVVK